MSTCEIPLIIFSIIALVILIGLNSQIFQIDGYKSFTSKKDNVPIACRCKRKELRIAMGDTWGIPVKCPKGTLMEGKNFWCTSNNHKCRDIACNSFY